MTRRTLKVKKKTGFIRFSESLNVRTDPSYVWKSCKILKNAWIKIKSKKLGVVVNRKNEILKTLNKLTPQGCSSDPNSIPLTPDNPLFDQSFTFDEFNFALHQKKTHSSAGFDGIDYMLLNRLPVQIKLILLDIFNEIHRTG